MTKRPSASVLRVTVPCLMFLVCQFSFGQQEKPGLPTVLQNAGFEDGDVGSVPKGWHIPPVCEKDGYSVNASDHRPLAGTRCAVLSRNAQEPPKSFGNIIQWIDAQDFRGKRVRFKAAVRTEVSGVGTRAQLWSRVDLPNQQTGFFDNMGNRPITAKEWKHYEIVGDIAEDAQVLVLGMLLLGNGSAALDDVTLEIVDASTPTTGAISLFGAPGLTELRMAATVHAKGTVTTATYLYPLPLSYRDQVPLSFQLRVEPPGVAKSVEIVKSAGENRVLKLTLRELDRHKAVAVSYQSVVLVGPTMFDRVPKTAKFPNAWPEEAKPWLQATWCCDHDNERLKKLSAEVRGDGDDVLQVIANVLATARKTFAEAQGRVRNLTAVEALDKQGSCTSCANLVAALLRGAGIPARVLAGYPLWSGPLQTHYIVEAYVPEFGWYPAESTRCVSPWPNHQQVHVSIVPIEHESLDKAGPRVTAAGAVPFLSLTEIEAPKSGVFSIGTLKKSCDHDCRMIRTIVDANARWSAALDWARPRWNDWLDSKPQVRDGRLSFSLDAAQVKAKTLDEVRTEFE